MSSRYDRQERIWGPEGQNRLGASKIAIIGEDQAAFPAALNAVLLGLNARLLITGQSINGRYELGFPLQGRNLSEEYKIILSQINPLVTTSQLSTAPESKLDSHLLEGVNAIIDTTNNGNSKEQGLEFAIKNNIPFISVSSTAGCVVIETGSCSQDFIGKPKGQFLAWPGGALAVELAKRFIMGEHVPEKEPLYIKPGCILPFSHPENGEELKPNNGDLSDKTALVVGVGGQGCFAVPTLAELNYRKVIYMDDKKVKDENLSRQPLYWDSVGEPKAEVCAKKHNLMARKEVAHALVKKFDENFGLDEPVNIIYGLTDTTFSRMVMSSYASRHRIPFIAAGSDPGGVDFCTYVPGKTACYTHSYLGMLNSAKHEERQARLNCTENPNAQVVMPNCFAGSMAAIFSPYLFDGGRLPFSGRLTYRSGCSPAFGQLPHKACNCHQEGPLDLDITRQP